MSRRIPRGGYRRITGAKVHRIDFKLRAEVYDQLSAMAGQESLVATFEKIVEREFDKRVKRMGFTPDKTETSC